MKKKGRVSVAVFLIALLLIGSAIPYRINAADSGDLTIGGLSFSREYRDPESLIEPVEVTNNLSEKIKVLSYEVSGPDKDVFKLTSTAIADINPGASQSVAAVALKDKTKVRLNGGSVDGYGKYTATLAIKYTIEGESEEKTTSQALEATVTKRAETVDAQRLLTKTAKAYDGTTNLITGASASYVNELFAGDDVFLERISASFDSPSVGTGKTITAQYTWKGEDASNYTLPAQGVAAGAITKANGQAVFQVQNMQEGGTLNYTLTSSTNNASSAVIHYKQKGQPDSDYTVTTPTTVGVYVARAVIPEAENYNQVTVTSEFTIYSENSDLELSARPMTGQYGETGDLVPLTFENKGASNLTGLSLSMDTDGSEAFAIEGDGALTSLGANATDNTTVKIKLKDNLRPGSYSGGLTVSYSKGGVTYISQVQISGTVSTRPLTLSNDLESNSKIYDGNTEAKAGNVTIGGLLSGDTVNVKATANYDTPDAGTNKRITIDYYMWGADAACYSIPSGRIVYDGVIEKAEGQGTVTIENIHRGQKIKPVLTSKTNDISNVTMYYKEEGQQDSSYTTHEPDKTGTFKAKAVFAATTNYKEATAETVFKVTEMDSDQSMYSIEGKKGDNGFYASDITITGKNGYLVSMGDDGLYTSGLTISESRGSWTLYLKHQETGVKPKPVAIPQMKIDKIAPKITGVSNGDELNSEKVRLTVTDTYLDRVLLNGKAQGFDGKQAVISLERGKKSAAYTLDAYDQCGNVTTVKFTVSGKAQRITGSGVVTLEEGVEYQFATGTWKIAGDDTFYRGDSSFYVYNSGQYNIIRQ